MLTYNHQQFLERALASVKAQTLWHECELLIGEDYSTDNSRKLIADFAARNGKSVIPFYSESCSIGFHRNLERLILASRGKYIAFLESDDWWSEPLKLEMQVNMLERDSTLSFCGGITTIVNELSSQHGHRSTGYIQPPPDLQRVTFRDLIYHFSFHASSVMIRRSCISLPDWIFKQYCMDRPLYLMAALHGDAGVIRRPLSVYRLHATGVWAPLGPCQKCERSVSLFRSFIKHFPRGFRLDFHAAVVGILWSYLGEALGDEMPLQALSILTKAWRISPMVCFKAYLGLSIQVLLRIIRILVKLSFYGHWAGAEGVGGSVK